MLNHLSYQMPFVMVPNRRNDLHKRILGDIPACAHMGFRREMFDENGFDVCATKCVYPGRLHGAYTSVKAIHNLVHGLAAFLGRANRWMQCRTKHSDMPTSSSMLKGYLQLSIGLHGERREDLNARFDPSGGHASSGSQLLFARLMRKAGGGSRGRAKGKGKRKGKRKAAESSDESSDDSMEDGAGAPTPLNRRGLHAAAQQ